MSEKTSKTAAKTASKDDSFDLDQFERLCEMMDKHDLREVELSRGSQTWSVKRGQQQVAVAAAAPAPVAAPAAAPAPAPAAAPAAPAAPAEAAAPASSGNYITSPTVGTFYTKPDPADPSFVSVGDTVTAETIVCLIEAMKVFNQIPTEKAGKIAKILVSDGEPVEFGQPLFELA